MELTDVETRDVRASSLHGIRSRIEKLNRKAQELGADPVNLVIHREFSIGHPEYSQEAIEAGRAPMIPMVEVSIEGGKVSLMGWRFVGTLDFCTLPGNVILREVPGEHLPIRFKEEKGTCDHCKKRINRRETFVVESVIGEGYKVVGRNCLRDFLGHDPSKLVKFLDGIWALLKEVGEDRDSWGSSSREELVYTVDRVLEVTAGVIRTFGWLSRTKASDTGYSTADRVLDIFLGSPDRLAQERINKMKEQIGQDPQDAVEASNSKIWAEGQPEDNSYLINIRTIAKTEAIPANLFGIACSIVSSYQRAMDRLKEQKRKQESLLNEWVDAQPKERVMVTIKVDSMKDFPSDFGLVTLIRFIDLEGRTLIWWTGSFPKIEVGDVVTAKATIKKLDEYKGRKQTVVTRMKIEDVKRAG